MFFTDVGGDIEKFPSTVTEIIHQLPLARTDGASGSDARAGRTAAIGIMPVDITVFHFTFSGEQWHETDAVALLYGCIVVYACHLKGHTSDESRSSIASRAPKAIISL